MKKPVSYEPSKIEKKWQKYWDKNKFYRAKDKSDKNYYTLVEFPFPSGAGLHTGHTRSYSAMDVISRKRRAEGYNVLFPIGWDAFGLPTENYAIKTGIQPQKATKQNTDVFRRQLKSLGISFDWSREVNTTDPKYYKWTQWIFLQMYKKGLAYKSKMLINWCPKDKIGLANEEVVNGCCERCGTEVEKREKEQWMLGITKYADRLDKDLDTVDYWEKIKTQQRNWIGKSEGSEMDFAIKNSRELIKVFTTRIDTLFGVTYLVIAPEHPLVEKLKSSIKNHKEVSDYVVQSKKKQEIDRTAEGKEKTGIQLKGVTAINPINNEEISVWIADYVLNTYGTGAIMAVPAHDARDFEFAKKFDLPIRDVVIPSVVDHVNPPRSDKKTKERKNVHAIVFDPKENKYLIIRNKKFGWDTVVIGGIEEGEDPIDSAIRELAEETGYTDLEFKRTLGGEVRAAYFAKHKDENRVAYATGLYFELKSHKREEFESGGENEGNEILWIDPKDFVVGKMVNSELPYWLERIKDENSTFLGEGVLVNSGKFNGITSKEAYKKITEAVGGRVVTKYKLRDWVFSRQRYWGEPIPMINCGKCGWQPVPEKDLPVKLPAVKKYEPTDTGESPLASIKAWVNTKCPNCKGPARRETDTMPNWAGSSWYYLRYVDPKNSKTFADMEKMKNWLPVDWYNGGMEHTTLHLLYSRFWHKFLYDIGAVNTIEPYQKRTSQGLILAEGGAKMSKSKGNVVNPDDLVKLYGADTLRVYQFFMGPFDQPIAWDTSNMIGSRRFIERAFNLGAKVKKTEASKDLQILLNKTIKKVGDDIENVGFNTAISALMILLNALEKEAPKNEYETFLKLLAPFAPHVTEELWSQLGHKKSIHTEAWPTFDETKLVNDSFKITIQINGKFRGVLETNNSEEAFVLKAAKEKPEVQKHLDGKEIIKQIYVKNRLLNFVVKG